ncbi:tol-pal system-associated acyl-CoA thioesterase [Glaciecola petra]|uniref:Tol-pal system-associated acyl-CoA thioesterase n=1 Tax=Glaciecola petra TaxID=3075602 RepID=A0ABU2ZPY4_9ALTE|nr:tol-pal system-associated acyl-CoA thioesterase [Aestuariibacter sp. P117]MDT0594677.1 tol-pal system-associated acyl-CoA thioesterase [Aestuariibacter sp. P117]
MNKFDIDCRVYYEDTDAGGIVYHANYLKYMERCRTEWVRALGIKQQYLLEQSLGFVVIDMSIAFKKSAKLDDIVNVSCELLKTKRASLLFSQEITHNNQTLVVAEVKVACVNTELSKPVPLPSELVDRLKEGNPQ